MPEPDFPTVRNTDAQSLLRHAKAYLTLASLAFGKHGQEQHESAADQIDAHMERLLRSVKK